MNLNLKWLIVTITASLGRTQQDGADKNCINFFYCHFPFSPGHHLYSMYKFVCIFEGPASMYCSNVSMCSKQHTIHNAVYTVYSTYCIQYTIYYILYTVYVVWLAPWWALKWTIFALGAFQFIVWLIGSCALYHPILQFNATAQCGQDQWGPTNPIHYASSAKVLPAISRTAKLWHLGYNSSIP